MLLQLRIIIHVDYVPSRVKYLTLLFRTESYDDVVNCYKRFKDPVRTESTLAMASLAKIGTLEAFATAREIMAQYSITSAPSSKSSGGRLTAIYAHFAYKLGQFGLAFDVLTDKRRVPRQSKLTTSLKILILTEVDRLEEALLLIRFVGLVFIKKGRGSVLRLS